MAHMADSLNAQTDMGFTDKDIDDVRRCVTCVRRDVLVFLCLRAF